MPFGSQKHAPAKKAAALADLAAGMDLGTAVAKHKIPKNTLQAWRNALNKKSIATISEERHAKFMAAFERFGTAIMEMLTAQAELLTDQKFLREQKTEDVIRHTNALADRLERLIRLQSGNNNPVSDTAIVRAEIVDA